MTEFSADEPGTDLSRSGLAGGDAAGGRARGDGLSSGVRGDAAFQEAAVDRGRGDRLSGEAFDEAVDDGYAEESGLTAEETDLVVVTGLSGGGRSTVARALENVGYYVVDNLPQALMLDMAQLAVKAGDAGRRTAMVLDVRSRAFSTDLAGAVHALRDRGFSPRVVFVDADDEVLIRRFESVRRSHPLQGDGRLADGIAAERKLLEEAREQADVIIDTSHLNVNQLRRRVEELFGGEDARKLRITVLSFGFKYGLPPDADYVMDARFLPNPFWVPELRDHTGLDESVSGYVLGQEGAGDFVATYASLIAATAPGFEREGKRYLTVAVGCTGGKHRSVAIAEELTSRLRDIRLSAHASHRDLGRE